MTTQTQEQQIEQLTKQVSWLTAQVMNVYARMQMPYVPADGSGAQNTRTETGMGAIVSPDKTNYL